MRVTIYISALYAACAMGATSEVSAVPHACKAVQPMPAKDFNTTEYLRASWYIQQQQITGYQKKEDLFCVVQTLALEGRKVPFGVGKTGQVVSVYNYATANSTSGAPVNNNTILCARQLNPKTDPARIINAPCFIPDLLAGDYWTIAAGPDWNRYDWAIVSAGQPTVQYADGCTTKLSGTNGAGLWLFSRKPVADPADITHMRSLLTEMGYTLSQLLDVPQAGCNYDGAKILPN